MNARRVIMIAGISAAATASGAFAQTSASIASPHPDPLPGRVDVTQFVNDARGGSERYRDRRAAIADGYRRLGPAFPGMGEHWVHPGLIVSGTLDARTPSVLCYADSAGIPTLVGVAYTAPVLPGEAPPELPPGNRIWHQHSDAVDDETLLLVHPAAHEGDASRTRLAMFHAWIWLDNPDGMFAQNNWTLPFAQLGLTTSRAATPRAAQAAALLTAGGEYYMKLLEALVRPSPAERDALRSTVAHAVDRAEKWRASLATRVVSEAASGELELIWTDMWRSLESAVSGPARQRLITYSERSAGHTH